MEIIEAIGDTSVYWSEADVADGKWIVMPGTFASQSFTTFVRTVDAEFSSRPTLSLSVST